MYVCVYVFSGGARHSGVMPWAAMLYHVMSRDMINHLLSHHDVPHSRALTMPNDVECLVMSYDMFFPSA